MAKAKTILVLELEENEVCCLKQLLGSMNNKQFSEHGIQGEDRQTISDIWDLLPFPEKKNR